MSPCPDRGRFQQLLAEMLPDAERGVLEAHLEECPACQKELEALTGIADTDHWRRLLAEDGREVPMENIDLGRWSDDPSAFPAEVLPRVDGYEILGELGRGGMGVVYKARQLPLQRLVALKMILAGGHAGERERSRFRQESEAVAQLQHPHIVQIHAVGEQDGRPFLCLEYVAGGSLAQKLAGQPQPARAAAQLLETLARAVQTAHERSIIHRDLKPANVLLTPDGTPKIVDFGLAKQLGGSQQTESGAILGTPSYMAPEQVQGRTQAIGPAADIYALGSVLYEMLTGRPPFRGESTSETFLQVVLAEPVPPLRLQPRLPRDLDTICLKCLAKDPRQRYPTALALADDLRRFQTGEPIIARPLRWPERAWRWARRRPAVSGLVLGLLLVALLGMAGVLWQWQDAVAGWGRAELNAGAAHAAQQQTARALDLAEDRLYFSRIAQARLEWRLNHDVLTAERLLNQCLPGPDGIDRRGWEWYYLKGLSQPELFTYRGHSTDHVSRVVYSPDGGYLASAGGGNPFFQTQGPASIRAGEVVVWEAATHRLKALFRDHGHLVNDLAFSPDGRWLATGGHDQTLRLYDLRDARTWEADPPVSVLSPGHAVYCLAFSPDSRRLALGLHSPTVQLWDMTRQPPQLAQELSGLERPIRTLAFSPNGQWLATAGGTGIGLWDLATGQLQQHMTEASRSLGNLCFSPDGRLVVCAGTVAILWDVAAGRVVHRLTGHASGVMDVAFSPDGRTVATSSPDRTIRLWDVASGEERRILRGHGGRVVAVSFHPDGKRLASAAQQPGEVRVWDLDRNPEIMILKTPQNTPPEVLAFDATNTRLLALPYGGPLLAFGPAAESPATLPLALSQKWLAPATLAAFTPDARTLAAVHESDPRFVNIWDLKGPNGTGDHSAPPVVRCVLQGHEHPVYQIAISRDGRRAAAASMASPQRLILVWDALTGKQVGQFTGRRPAGSRLFGGLAFGPGDRQLAFDDYEEALDSQAVIRIHDLDTGEELRRLRGPSGLVSDLTFSPVGGWLAVAESSGQLRLWEVATGRPLHAAPLEGPTYQLSFSPDGRRLAAVNRTYVKLWDVASGQEILVLQGVPPPAGDSGFNPRIAWSPDGLRLAATNWNGTISLWDAAAAHAAFSTARAP